MTEKEQLIQEIDQIKAKHKEGQIRRRKKRIIAVGTVLLLLVISLCIIPASRLGDRSVGPFESIAGTYGVYSVIVVDSMGFPEKPYGMGECIISADGSIEFPYYDGEPSGKGEFKRTKGKVRPYQYANHDYEVEIDGYELHDVYLDMDSKGMEMHQETTYRGAGKSAYYREYVLLCLKRSK